MQLAVISRWQVTSKLIWQPFVFSNLLKSMEIFTHDLAWGAWINMNIDQKVVLDALGGQPVLVGLRLIRLSRPRAVKWGLSGV